MTTTLLERAAQPNGKYIGAPLRKINGDLFVSGGAIYVGDVMLPGMHYVAILRSPHANARIVAIDTSAATSAPGVIKVVTGAEIKAHCNPIPHWVNPLFLGGKTVEVYPLAIERVSYVGQPVAAVVAAGPNDAEAALELIKVEYEARPAVIDAIAALQPDAPKVYEEWDDNLILKLPFAGGDVDGAFAQADHSITETFSIHRYNVSPIEPRGYVAHFNKYTSQMTLYGSVQNPHPLRTVLAEALGMPENQLRIIAPHVGGAFGSKMHGHPEEPLLCILAKLTGVPVKWIESRREHMLIGGRQQTHRFEAAFNSDGQVLAVRDDVIADVGALGALVGWPMAYLTGLTFPCGYDMQNLDVRVSVVATNKAPWNASRGYGKEATNLVMERIMDLVAQKLGMDPAEVRKKNFVQPDQFPYTTVSGLILDSGRYEAALTQALDLIGYEQLRAEQARLRSEGRYIGIGMAYELTPEGGALPATLVAGYDTTTVRVDPSGKLTVLTGVTTPGGSNETGIAQIVADELGVDIGEIRVAQGDTDVSPYGFGNYSGRSMLVGGASAKLAAVEIRQKMAKLAGAMLEANEQDIIFASGKLYPRGSPDRALSFAEVARAAYTRAYDVGAVIEPTLTATKVYRPGHIRHIPDERGRINTYPSYSNGAYIAVVEVDIETGQVKVTKFSVVHDCGTIINPVFVEGQSQGAISMGIGAALFEQAVYAADGQFLTTGFKDYLLPRAADIPPIIIGHQETPNPFSLLGSKGAGEAGVGGATAAVVNAIADALSSFGVTPRQLPLTPPNVLQMLRDEAKP